MSDVGFIPQQKYVFPMTDFIVALHKMTPEQKLAASPEKAAERYGLSVDRCRWWIGQAQREEQWPVKTRR